MIHHREKILGFILLVLLLLVWEAVSRLRLVDSTFLPPFTEILLSLARMVWSGELIEHISYTLGRCLLGFILACIIAVPIGIAMGLSRIIYGLLEPLVEILRPLPSAAIIPVVILFLGIFTLYVVSKNETK